MKPILCAPCLLLVAPLFADADPHPLRVVVDGSPRAAIVVPVEHDWLTDKAAGELQECIHRMTGARLPIVAGPAVSAAVRIHLGATPAAPPPPADLNAEGFILQTRGDDLYVIAGGYGVLYGVYELLERMGVRWFLPDPLGEVVPERRSLSLPSLDVRQEPSFPMRWAARDEWGLHLRCNRVDDDSLPPAFRIRPGIYHTQNALLPHRKHYRTHPEFYALVKGARSNDPQCKLCYSNPEVAARVAASLARLLDRDPGIDYLSLSPTDGQLWCECARCRALDENGVPRDQRLSRRSLLFYNAVLEQLTRTHPDALMLTGAYNVYTLPPRDETLRAHPNLGVIVCHYEDYCLAHPVNDPHCPRNRRYLDLIRAWQRHTPRILFYEYYWKVNWFDMPWPVVHTIAADIPFFHSIGVQGLHSQWTPANCWTVGLNHYIAAHLLWDVKADVDALVEEFCRGLFGPAAPAVRRYYQRLEDRIANCGVHFPGNALVYGGRVMTRDLMESLDGDLTEAESLADSPIVRQRLAKLRTSWEYTNRLSAYLRLRSRWSQVRDPDARRRLGPWMVSELADIVHDVRTDRVRYDGVVSPNVVRKGVYLDKELRRIRARLLPGDTTKPAGRRAPSLLLPPSSNAPAPAVARK